MSILQMSRGFFGSLYEVGEVQFPNIEIMNEGVVEKTWDHIFPFESGGFFSSEFTNSQKSQILTIYSEICFK